MPHDRNQASAKGLTNSANSIALSQTLGAAGPVTLNGALAAAGVATLAAVLPSSQGGSQPIIITSGGNDSAVKFTITGTDTGGATISEVLLGSNGATATSKNNYQTVTSIVASAATSAITIGTAGAVYSAWVIVGAQRNAANETVRAWIGTDGGGSAEYDVQATSDPEIMNNTGGGADDILAVSSANTTGYVSYNISGWRAYRLKAYAGSSQATVTLRVMPNRTA